MLGDVLCLCGELECCCFIAFQIHVTSRLVCCSCTKSVICLKFGALVQNRETENKTWLYGPAPLSLSSIELCLIQHCLLFVGRCLGPWPAPLLRVENALLILEMQCVTSRRGFSVCDMQSEPAPMNAPLLSTGNTHECSTLPHRNTDKCSPLQHFNAVLPSTGTPTNVLLSTTGTPINALLCRTGTLINALLSSTGKPCVGEMTRLTVFPWSRHLGLKLSTLLDIPSFYLNSATAWKSTITSNMAGRHT